MLNMFVTHQHPLVDTKKNKTKTKIESAQKEKENIIAENQ